MFTWKPALSLGMEAALPWPSSTGYPPPSESFSMSVISTNSWDKRRARQNKHCLTDQYMSDMCNLNRTDSWITSRGQITWDLYVFGTSSDWPRWTGLLFASCVTSWGMSPDGDFFVALLWLCLCHTYSNIYIYIYIYSFYFYSNGKCSTIKTRMVEHSHCIPIGQVNGCGRGIWLWCGIWLRRGRGF